VSAVTRHPSTVKVTRLRHQRLRLSRESRCRGGVLGTAAASPKESPAPNEYADAVARLAQVGTTLLGSSLVEGAARAATRRGLRVLAYHGVPHSGPFAEQMIHLAEAYHPVSGGDVLEALAGERPLPDLAVWVTFDDGRPDVVENALPALQHRKIPATLFVVAGVVDTTEPFWWEIIEKAESTGTMANSATLGLLKRAPDEERRAQISYISEQLTTMGWPVSARQLTSTELHQWLDAGMEIGNHSWDHPCLDRCPADAQVEQIDRAHEKLSGLTGDQIRLFAYPNRNFSKPVDDELRRLNYGVGLLFDHRIAKLGGNPLAMSRLRIDSQAPLPRFRAIVSGGHPALFATHRRVSALVRR
jgi:peptidoglycan/xylan/chitin deacetylase (PgdA/CDA1 family)